LLLGKSTPSRQASKQTVNVSHKWGSANRENRRVARRDLINKLGLDIQETRICPVGIPFTDCRYIDTATPQS
jgi:hypothetical protein